MNYFKFLSRFSFLLLAFSASVFAQDPGWPRKLEKPGGIAIVYQPQVDEWKDYSTINMRVAFQLTPIGGKQVIGAATMTGNTNVDKDKHMVFIYGIKVTNTYFPSLDEGTSARMDQLFKTFVPEVFNISLERIVAYMPKPESVPTVNVKNDPPFVFVNYSPAVLLAVDGEPVLASIKDTKLKFIVNTQWAVFQDTKSSQYYLLAGPRWLTAADLHGPWSAATKLPKDMEKLPKDPQWADLKKVIPLSADSNAPIPKVFYSTVPAEVILFNGKPVYAKIPQTQLLYATNTDSPFFLYTPTNEYYYLTSGRWFRSKDMQGKWSFASAELPEDFAKIPRSSPASAVLSSVPGTEEAKDAVLIAQVPTVMEIDPKSAAAQAKVSYSGDPQFAPIEGTSLYYATNTSRQSDQSWGCLLFMPAGRVVHVSERSRPLDDSQFHSAADLHHSSELTGIQRHLCDSDHHSERNGVLQSHGRIHGNVCCRSDRCLHHGILLSAVHVLPAVWISGLLPISAALWVLRLRIFLQHQWFLRRLSHSLRSLWLSNTSGFVQSIYRHLQTGHFCRDSLREANRWASLQPLYRNVRRDASGIQSHRAMGAILRFEWK